MTSYAGCWRPPTAMKLARLSISLFAQRERESDAQAECLRPSSCFVVLGDNVDEVSVQDKTSEPGFDNVPVQISPCDSNLPAPNGLRCEFRLHAGRTILLFLSLFLVSWLLQYWGHS